MSGWILKIILYSLKVILLLESCFLGIDHPLIPSLVVLMGVQCLSVLEFEYLLLDIRSLVILRVTSVQFLEIKSIETVLFVTENLLFIQILNINIITSSTLSSSL
jgi:hypothetical protein